MMRALWTAGSGMTAQQLNVDVISNNLANVNTTGYKKQRVEYEDLLYETLARANVLDGNGKPVNLQVGHGTTAVATARSFTPGNLDKTDNPLDFAIDGDGFFMVQGPKGQINYTRDGSFKLSPVDGGNKLVSSDGFPVLDDSGNEIIFNIDTSKLNVSSDGEFSYMDENGETVSLGQKLGLVKFENPAGLESIGMNLYATTSASGQPILDSELGDKSVVCQKFLESSNVQVVEEMVRLIIAQRAYEINSKAIQSADEMLQLANNLRR